MIPFYVFLFCLFATYGTYLVITRKRVEHRAQMHQRMKDLLISSVDLNDPRIQLERANLLSEIPMVHQLLIEMPWAVRLKQLIDQADLQLTVMRLFLFSALAATMAALAVSSIFSDLLLIALASTIAASLPFLHILWKRKKRLDKFLADLPEALELMSRSLLAGHAFSEAIQMISEEMPDPIAMEFRRTYDEHNLGLSMRLALENLARRIPVLDLRICLTAIQIQRETGGNLSEILEKVAMTIRERFRILEDLKTLTMQSRLSAWLLCAIPNFLAVVLTLINREYMSVFWHDPRGQKLAAVALVMQVAGIYWVQKIIRIRI